MTASIFSEKLISIVADLSQDLPAKSRYERLLSAMQNTFPCDAAALLRLEGKILKPLAVDGLTDDTMGRRFAVEDNPRLACLLHTREPVRFAADSELPDPYDGLVNTSDHLLHVHDCMGASLYIDESPWGVLTLDALRPGTFDQIDPIELRTFISLTEATIKAAERINALEIRIEKEHQVTRVLLEEGDQAELIGTSPVMQHLRDEITVVAQSSLTVLVLGETGVGKELVARQVHALSSRAQNPLIYVNCAALPENIAESELFGHTRGAFSGADSNRAGKFEIADGGTLFLDEVGELPLSIQAKLLRALQSGEIQRVGSDSHIQVDVRIVAATNRDLKAEVSSGRFRADLYHRLAVYPIYVPPLRERNKDVLLLAGYFLEANQRGLGIRRLLLPRKSKQILMGYSWPGNVRELNHLLSRAALKAITKQGRNSSSVTIQPVYLDIATDKPPPEIINEVADSPDINPDENLSLKEVTDQFQRNLIIRRLAAHDDNRAAVARELGMDRGNFYRLLKRLGL